MLTASCKTERNPATASCHFACWPKFHAKTKNICHRKYHTPGCPYPSTPVRSPWSHLPCAAGGPWQILCNPRKQPSAARSGPADPAGQHPVSVREREITQLIRAYTNKGLIQESMFPAIPTDPFPNSTAPPFCGAVSLPHVNKRRSRTGPMKWPKNCRTGVLVDASHFFSCHYFPSVSLQKGQEEMGVLVHVRHPTDSWEPETPQRA